MRRSVVAQLVVHVVGIRPNDRHLFNLFTKRKNAIIFQQYSGFQRHLFGQSCTFFRAHFGFGKGFVNVWVVEQAKVVFQLQDMSHGMVNVAFGDEASLQGFFQETTIIITSQVDVDTSLQGQGSGFGRVGSHVLGGIDGIDGVEVGEDHALEIP